jgi:FkbM family methyltransferase
MYDVGANVGAYSFIAHLVTSGDCTIYALEPSFSTFAALSRNVLLNYCDKSIKPLLVALSSETGLNELVYSQIEPGAALHRLLNENVENGNSPPAEFIQPILCYRLDDLIDQFGLRSPNLIKIDVDGAELNVLNGAIKTLGRPELRTVLIEIDDRSGPSQEIFPLMKKMKFQVWSRHPRRGSETVANYIFGRAENP